jgi:S1-C subfamily serine protease
VQENNFYVVELRSSCIYSIYKFVRDNLMQRRTITTVLSGLLLLVPIARAQTSATSPSAIFSRVHSSVVVIFAMDEHGERTVQGSGFIVGKNKVATNHHVVESMSQAYVIFSDGDIKTVTGVVADSAEQDLTILSVETGPRPTLALGDELALREGDSVYALGAPRGRFVAHRAELHRCQRWE